MRAPSASMMLRYATGKRTAIVRTGPPDGRRVRIAIGLLVLIGAMGGYFVVPMNALLQHRGHLLVARHA